MRRKMFRPFLCAVLSALTCAAPVFADDALNNFYIVDDSDSRYLTRDELWEWQYDALGYIYNEIFARHGRPFRPANATTSISARKRGTSLTPTIISDC